jgi:uncharacterized protein (DUF2062 family)
MKFSRAAISAALVKAINQGTSPSELAFTCSLGVVIGLLPVWGVTTLVCFVLSLVLRLNLVVIQLVNYLVVPFQLLLLVPFIRAGAWMTGQRTFAYTLDELMILFKEKPVILLQEAGLAVALGVACWLIVAVPVFFLLYFPLRLAFGRLRQRELKSE